MKKTFLEIIKTFNLPPTVEIMGETFGIKISVGKNAVHDSDEGFIDEDYYWTVTYFDTEEAKQFVAFKSNAADGALNRIFKLD